MADGNDSNSFLDRNFVLRLNLEEMECYVSQEELLSKSLSSLFEQSSRSGRLATPIASIVELGWSRWWFAYPPSVFSIVVGWGLRSGEKDVLQKWGELRCRNSAKRLYCLASSAPSPLQKQTH